VVVVEHAYHGNTQATFEISTEDIAPDDRPPQVIAVPAPDTYRGLYREGDTAAHYAAEVQSAIAALQSRGVGFAAFIIDTIASSSGVVAPPAGFLAAVRDIVAEAGGLFIADEVQPGLGRTGRHFWGFEADRIEPDIVTLGKPLGNGHPLAATIARRELVEAFAKGGSYFNTFGGNPVSAAAGLAVLDVLESEGLVDNARDQGDYLLTALRELAAEYECIGDVRGHGLFLAVELVADREARSPAARLAKRVVNGLKDRGVLTSTIGPDNNILKLRPPMVLTRQDAGFFIDRLAGVLGDLGVNN
jgi:4-aminobutyrate aminotransferase-like enzyme